MEVKLSDLRKMSRRERNRTIGELARAATVHRENQSVLASIVHALRGFFMPGRVPR
jgi:ribosomal protein L29